MGRKKPRTLGATSQGFPAWISTSKDNSTFRKGFNSDENQIKKPAEIAVECVSVLADLLKYYPDIAIQIQDRLKF